MPVVCGIACTLWLRPTLDRNDHTRPVQLAVSSRRGNNAAGNIAAESAPCIPAANVLGRCLESDERLLVRLSSVRPRWLGIRRRRGWIGECWRFGRGRGGDL